MYQPKETVAYKKGDVYICCTSMGDLIDKVILEVNQNSKALKVATVNNWLDSYYTCNIYKWVAAEEFHRTVKAKIGVTKEVGFWIFKYKTIVYE